MMTLTLVRYALGACAIALLASCSGGSQPNPGTITRAGGNFTGDGLGSGPNLYVSNHGNSTVAIYGLKKGKLLGTISAKVDAPDALAFGNGQLWVANTQPLRRGRNWAREGSVAIYIPGSESPEEVLEKEFVPQAFAFDASGNAYVANKYKWEGFGLIYVYAPGARTATRSIGDNSSLAYADGLALDSAGNLYVSNWAGGEGQPAQNSISVFNVNSGTFEYAITQGVYWPRTVSISGGFLYTANGPVKGVKKLPNGSITVYPLGSASPSLTITQGIRTPVALAFDSAGNLYVANLNGPSVTVYAPGGSTPIRTITHGVTSPKSLAIGMEGDLYVANLYENTISVYPPSTTEPRLTITAGLSRPNSIALQPTTSLRIQ